MPFVVLAREPRPDRTEEMVPPWALSAVAMLTVPLTSEPLTSVMALVTVVVVRSTAPPLMLTAPVPSAALSATVSVPPVTLVPPVKVLAPPRVWLPVPVLERAVAPPIAPVKVASVAPPRVTVEAAPALARAPEPVRPATEMDLPLRSTVPVPSTLTVLAVLPRAAALPRVTVPPATVTPPVKVLAALSATLPAVVKPALPVRTVATVPELATSLATSNEPPVSVPPAMETILTMLLPPRFNEPPVRETGPAPSALLAPRVTVPAAMEAPPRKVLVLDSTKVPVPVLVREPSPARSEEIVPPVAARVVAVARLIVPPVIVPPLRKTRLPTLEVPRATVPVLTVRAPVPSAASLPTLRVPPPTVTSPLKALAPLRVAAPAPVLAMPP